jgi:hypothetical protein
VVGDVGVLEVGGSEVVRREADWGFVDLFSGEAVVVDSSCGNNVVLEVLNRRHWVLDATRKLEYIEVRRAILNEKSVQI